ncbi:Co-chaperone [Dipsacomyces acuminosporus]|nr:Co-chaperone [Dipsacomyces acuminosporus]
MADWRNVGNWHWKEKNCLDWAKQYFEEKLPGTEIKKDGIAANVTSVNSVTGDVDLNMRKGRLITIYDVEIKLGWTATQGDNSLSGTITIPEVAHDTDDYVYDVVGNNVTSEKFALKEFVRKDLTKEITKKLEQFSEDLKKAHGSDMYIPDKDSNSGASTPSTVNADLAKDFKQGKIGGNSEVSVSKTSDSVISTVSISQNVEFVCSADDLFLTLTDPQRVSIWTRANAQIQPLANTKFSLFGGHIEGEMLKCEKGKAIEQTWRVATWPKDHYSKVTLTFEQLSSSTRLSLKQTGVPFNEEDATKANWDRYYWNSIKGSFG